MKTRILILLGVLMMVTTVKASISKKQSSKWDYNFHDAEPISFNERGIKFYIFPDGEMDFDIHANDYGTTTEYYYRGPENKSRRNSRYNRGTKVVKDYRGRIIRVGNVFINYNYKGQIRRVGSVSIGYRRSLMTRVGGLRLLYDRFGNIRYRGQVKHRYSNSYYQNYYSNYFYNNYEYSYNDDFFNHNNFSNNYEQFNEDENYYYYRSKGTTSKIKNGKREVKQKMIKRKKLKTKDKTPKKRKRRGKTS